MKRFIKNFYIYFLFILAQTVFIFLDYVYINIDESIDVHITLFLVTATITFISLSIRTIFEAMILKAVSAVFKKTDTLRQIVKTLFNSMRFSIILTAVFGVVQLIFIRREASVYQLTTLGCVNLVYMAAACVKFKKANNNPAFYTFVLYSVCYLAYQIYNYMII